jgi:dicarboxylate transporter 10
MSSNAHQSIVSLVTEITKQEGIRWMFKGWVPSFIRVGPHTILTFLFLEQHKKMYREFKGL